MNRGRVGAMVAVTVLLVGLGMTAVSIGADIPSVGTPKGSGISVSPHNMNAFGVQVENQEVCRPCHTPHNSQAKTLGLLWNHQVNTGATYTLYKTSSSYVGLDSSSKLCLSCHDGAIAVDNYGGKTTGTHFVTGSKAVGLNGDLSDDHPVGVKYPGTFSADGKTWTPSVSNGVPSTSFNDPTAAVFSADGPNGGSGLRLATLPDGSKGIGCGTCHNPHVNSNGDFLRTSMQYSFLCLKCHNK